MGPSKEADFAVMRRIMSNWLTIWGWTYEGEG